MEHHTRQARPMRAHAFAASVAWCMIRVYAAMCEVSHRERWYYSHEVALVQAHLLLLRSVCDVRRKRAGSQSQLATLSLLPCLVLSFWHHHERMILCYKRWAVHGGWAMGAEA